MQAGWSTRTRRKPLLVAIPLALLGNTSAFAEKTHSTHFALIINRKHLRLRGENRNITEHPAVMMETPPLTRRKQKFINILKSSERNTSAYAEKTILASLGL